MLGLLTEARPPTKKDRAKQRREDWVLEHDINLNPIPNWKFSKVVKSFRNDTHAPLKQGKNTKEYQNIRICAWLYLRCPGYKVLSPQ